MIKMIVWHRMSVLYVCPPNWLITVSAYCYANKNQTQITFIAKKNSIVIYLEVDIMKS